MQVTYLSSNVWDVSSSRYFGHLCSLIEYSIFLTKQLVHFMPRCSRRWRKKNSSASNLPRSITCNPRRSSETGTDCLACCIASWKRRACYQATCRRCGLTSRISRGATCCSSCLTEAIEKGSCRDESSLPQQEGDKYC